MEGADEERLSDVLKALANPVRLRLLRDLQRPKALADIRISPFRKEGDERPDRPMSRVTVRQHLEHLIQIGAVERISQPGPGRPAETYAVVPGQLFVLAEELMEVARVQRRVEANEATRRLDGLDQRAQDGVGFVLVNGVYEGRWLPLDPFTKDGEGWTIGRAHACSVSLPFDPYVSTSHAVVEARGDRYVIRAEPGTRNPLMVDWDPVPDDVEVELAPGRVLTVGRSTLVFRD